MAMSLMREEIREQPAALERTLERELPRLEELRRAFSRQRPPFILLAARGTSDNAAHFGRYLLEIATGIPCALAAPSVFTVYKARPDLAGALVIAISQSGESTDTNLVLERAAELGALTVGITNEAHSTLARLASHVILVHAGRERSVAATKTYTGQLMALYLLAYALGAPIQPDDLRRLPGVAAAALETESEIGQLAVRYRFMNDVAVVGRGLNYANALEFSLKLMETCSIVAEGFSAADFLHGPIAMVERSFPVFLFAPGGPTWRAIKQVMEKLRRRGAETLAITDNSNREAQRMASRAIQVSVKTGRRRPSPADLYTPIPYIIPAQLFACSLAEEKGLDPDCPSGLTKVTRTL
ncbi:MAG: SIS domain-containing protein [Bryobacteraceae bacterium]